MTLVFKHFIANCQNTNGNTNESRVLACVII